MTAVFINRKSIKRYKQNSTGLSPIIRQPSIGKLSVTTSS